MVLAGQPEVEISLARLTKFAENDAGSFGWVLRDSLLNIFPISTYMDVHCATIYARKGVTSLHKGNASEAEYWWKRARWCADKLEYSARSISYLSLIHI